MPIVASRVSLDIDLVRLVAAAIYSFVLGSCVVCPHNYCAGMWSGSCVEAAYAYERFQISPGLRVDSFGVVRGAVETRWAMSPFTYRGDSGCQAGPANYVRPQVRTRGARYDVRLGWVGRRLLDLKSTFGVELAFLERHSSQDEGPVCSPFRWMPGTARGASCGRFRGGVPTPPRCASRTGRSTSRTASLGTWRRGTSKLNWRICTLSPMAGATVLHGRSDSSCSLVSAGSNWVAL